MITIQQTQLEQDYRYCEKIIKKHSKSFYYAFSRLPNQKAKAVYAIYAFCRVADDSVDESPDKLSRLRNLQTLRNELQAFENSQEEDTPLWRALRDVFTRFDMDIQPFYDQLDGQKMDIDFTAPHTMADVENYSYYVAGSVGRMLSPIIASASTTDITNKSIQLGIAMQLTNILRDVGEDFQDKGRVYLPLELLQKHGYTVSDLKNGNINNAFIRVWEDIAVRSEELYDNFQSAISELDADSQFPVALSSRVYRGILDAVRENGYNCHTKRNFVSPISMNKIYQSVKTAEEGVR